MSASESADPAEVRERRYRRLLRAHPIEWRQSHGEVVLATLLDAAEARGGRRPSLREAADLLGRGAAVRSAATFSPPVRSSIASTALGVGLSFAVAYFIAYSWVRPDNHSGTAVSGPVWFLPAWCLLAAGAIARKPAMRVAAWVIAVAAFVTVAQLLPGPFVLVPWTQWGSIYERAGRFGLDWYPHAIRPNGGTVAVLVVLATLTLVGPVRRARPAQRWLPVPCSSRWPSGCR